MSTQINNVTNPPSPPPAADSSAANTGDLSSSLAAVQSLLQTSQEMLMSATDTLVESMKPKDSKHSATSEVQGAMKAAPASNGALSQTQLITQAYAYIAEIDNLYQSADAGTLTYTQLNVAIIAPSAWINAGPYFKKSAAPYYALTQLESQITDPDVKSLIDKVVNELSATNAQGQKYANPPQPAAWRTWWNNNTQMVSSMSAWLSNKDNGDAVDTDLTRPEDQMNLIQIMIDLSQKSNITVQGKSLDTLFWGLNSDISQTVAAFFMEKDGNWADAQKDIDTFLQLMPPANTVAAPNYSKFIQGLTDVSDPTKTTSWPYPYISAQNLLSDGFAFTDAWANFRTGTPIVSPDYITFGS